MNDSTRVSKHFARLVDPPTMKSGGLWDRARSVFTSELKPNNKNNTGRHNGVLRCVGIAFSFDVPGLETKKVVP